MTLPIETHTFELNGRQLTLRKLNFRQALPIYCKFQPIMAAFFDQAAAAPGGLAVFQIVGSMGRLSYEDLDYYIQQFGPSTTVDFGDGRVLPLKLVPATKTAPAVDPVSELFDDDMPGMFKWLDECVRFNFGATIAKTFSALKEEPGRAVDENPAE